MIRLADPALGEAEIEQASEVLRSGHLVQGARVAAFEGALGAFLGVPNALAASSGTAALHLALLALGVGPGDAVLVPAFTFPATANVVELVGARPVFVDVKPDTYCLDPNLFDRAIDEWDGPERLRAAIPVHEFGAPCDLAALGARADRAGLVLVEDAACALGTRWQGRHVGTFGALGCFSWHPRKAITTGEGGAVCTADPALAERVALLRNHGIRRGGAEGWDLVLPGLNYRLTEFQAALGQGQLARFGETLALRRELVAHYRQSLEGVPGLRLPAKVEGHAWQTFMVVLPPGVERSAVAARLHADGIEAGAGAQAVPLLTYYREKYALPADRFPVAAELFRQGLALPLHPRLTPRDVARVATSLRKALSP